MENRQLLLDCLRALEEVDAFALNAAHIQHLEATKQNNTQGYRTLLEQQNEMFFFRCNLIFKLRDMLIN